MPNHEGYVAVLGEALRHIVQETIAERGGSADPFDHGYLMGLHRVITLMQQTAEQFEIPPDDLGVADIDETMFLR
jgi:hypothetical protein